MALYGSIYSSTGEDPRQILASQNGLQLPPGGAVFEKGTRDVKPGMPIRKITGAGSHQYFWEHSKVSKITSLKKDGTAHTNTATEITVGNPDAYNVGDSIVVGANAAKVISGIDYTTGIITLAALSGAPTDGDRVKSNTAAENQIDALAFNWIAYDANNHQAMEIATAGCFIKERLEDYMSTDDILNANGVTTGLGARLVNANGPFYRWQ